jgi:hypothetical protein
LETVCLVWLTVVVDDYPRKLNTLGLQMLDGKQQAIRCSGGEYNALFDLRVDFKSLELRLMDNFVNLHRLDLLDNRTIFERRIKFLEVLDNFVGLEVNTIDKAKALFPWVIQRLGWLLLSWS